MQKEFVVPDDLEGQIELIKEHPWAIGMIWAPAAELQSIALSVDGRYLDNIKGGLKAEVLADPKIKHNVIKHLLELFKEGKIHDLRSRIEDLNWVRIDWPELRTISNSFEHDWNLLRKKITPLEEDEVNSMMQGMLIEDLGNLAQLNVGPLINVLKQSGHFASRSRGRSNRYGSNSSPIGNRFHQHGIGSTSEIVDLGVLKQGIKSLRKGFKDNDGARGFAAYIGGTAVMFGITDEYDLAGSSRESLVAYDLTKWSDIMDQMYAKSYQKPSPTSIRSEPSSRYDDRPDRPRRYAGKVMDTGSIVSMFTVMQEISKQTGEPLTAKLVMNDSAAMAKRRRRIDAREISNGAKDLRTRLAYYKNSKKPTVNSVKEFIAMSLKNPGSKVQFAGITYHLKSSNYDKIDPSNLLKGVPFSVSYSSADPGVYDSLYITYKFDTETNQLLPIKASFRDRRPGSENTSQEEILDPRLYLIHTMQTRSLDDKSVVLPKILTMVKAQRNDDAERMMKAMEMMGTVWSEFAAIRKSIAAQKQG